MKMLYIKHRSGKVMNNFALSAILAARELGIDFTIANNMSMADKEHFKQICEFYGIKMVHIDFDRNPLSPKNLHARKQLLALMREEKYDIMHCNTPSGGMVGRLCAAQMKTSKVIYMAHGFHFWTGAPLKYWVLYYPVERFLAHLTDRIITINKEDFERAKRFHYKKGGKAVYVPGVGIDIQKFQFDNDVRAKKRNELGIKNNEIMLLSVGELNENKNQKVVIEAIEKLNRKDIKYVICGVGPLEGALKTMARNLGVMEQVIFAGFRTDIKEYYQAADAFVISSFREGLSVSLMEAMSTGIPCIAGSIRGNVDLLPNSCLLFDVKDSNDLCNKIILAIKPDVRKKEVEQNTEKVKDYSVQNATTAMKKIYNEVISEMENG